MGRQIGYRSTLETRIKCRNGHMRRQGKSVDSPAEMLDLYLLGERAIDIAEAYGISVSSFYKAVAKEALFRLMAQQNAEHLSEFMETDIIHQ